MKNIIEVITGFLIIVILFYVILFIYKCYVARNSNGYNLQADFANVEGLIVGNDVKLWGVRIGYVQSITLNQEKLVVVTKLNIEKNIKIPIDSRAVISNQNFLGNYYIKIIPGIDNQYLLSDGIIPFTQSALNLDDIINKIILQNKLFN